MDGWMDGWEWNRVECGSFGRGSEQHNTVDSATETPPRARLRNSRTPAGFTPKGWPIGLRKAKRDRWMDGWMDGGGMGWKLWPWPIAAPWIAKSKERWMDGWMGMEWGGSFGRGPEQHPGFGCRNTS